MTADAASYLLINRSWVYSTHFFFTACITQYMRLCKLRAAAEAGAVLPPCPSQSLVYRLAQSQSYRRKEIPSAVRAAVFVLPNSILFHSLSADSVYFGALLHR